jgi:low temperature requirement protein LtrA
VVGSTGLLANQLGLAFLTMIALWAVAFHVGNGILTALRFVVSRPRMQEQPAVRAICAAVGLVLITAGFCGWTALLVQSRSVQPAALAQAQPHEHR